MKIKKKGKNSLFGLVQSVSEGRNLPIETVAELLSQSIKVAYLKAYPDNVVEVDINLEQGSIEVWRELQVVTDDFFKKDGFEDWETLIPESKVSTLPKTSRNPSKPKVGDLVYEEVDISTFPAKIVANIQMFFKKLTENEVSRSICRTWLKYQGQVMYGVVDEIIEKKEDKSVKRIIVSITSPEGDVAKGIISKSDLVWFENSEGQKIPESLTLGHSYLFYIKEVSDINVRFPITLSRIDSEIVEFLMKQHVTEMAEGLIEVKSIARIAGVKTKILVASNKPNIDPVGCCIGPKGKRLKIVSQELMNEKIDVILYNEDPIQNVINSFVTGRILGYRIDPEPNSITLIATLDNLLACIGKRGSNTKLVYMLTNWKINMKTIQEAKDENIDYISIDDDKFVSSNRISERIFKMHFKKTEDILRDFDEKNMGKLDDESNRKE